MSRSYGQFIWTADLIIPGEVNGFSSIKRDRTQPHQQPLM